MLMGREEGHRTSIWWRQARKSFMDWIGSQVDFVVYTLYAATGAGRVLPSPSFP